MGRKNTAVEVRSKERLSLPSRGKSRRKKDNKPDQRRRAMKEIVRGGKMVGCERGEGTLLREKSCTLTQSGADKATGRCISGGERGGAPRIPSMPSQKIRKAGGIKKSLRRNLSPKS